MSSRRRYQPDYEDADEGEIDDETEFNRIESEAHEEEMEEKDGNEEHEGNEESEGGEVSLGDGVDDPDQSVSMFAPEWNSSVRVDRNLPIRPLAGEEDPLDEELQGYFRARPAPPRNHVEIKYLRPDLASARRKQIENTLLMDPVYMEDRRNEQDKLLVLGYKWISRPRCVRNPAPRKSEMTKILAPDSY